MKICFSKLGKKMVCCAAINCSNRTEQGFRLFRLPADTKRRSTWIHNMRRGNWKPNGAAYICEVRNNLKKYILDYLSIVKLK